MGRTERFNYTSDEEKQSLINKAKKGVAAVALAATGLFASACSGGEGEAKGPSVGGILSTGGSSEVLYGESCANAENVWSVGSTSPGSEDRPDNRFYDLADLKAHAGVPDGIAKLSPNARGYILDLDTLSSQQDDQLWESYTKAADGIEESRTKESTYIVVYGEAEQSLIDEYKSGSSWPESLTDGVIDTPELNLCVMNQTLSVKSENWIQ